MTLRQLYEEGISRLEECGLEEARLDAWLLLEYQCHCTRAYFYAHPDAEVKQEDQDAYHALLRKRGSHVPLQYLTNQAWFMGLPVYVDERVLIPRQDTEILAEEALSYLKQKEREGEKRLRILDLCTGSGCLLLSLLTEIPQAAGVGADISEDALAVARENVSRLRLGDTGRVSLRQLDVMKSLDSLLEDGPFDLIVSNPPYIPGQQISSLMEEVRLHEPRIALDGGEDGLIFYRRIVKCTGLLKDGGLLACEIGADQGEAVRQLFAEAGFTKIRIVKDLAGLDRVVSGKIHYWEEFTNV